MVYLDNAATSYPKPDAVHQAVAEYMRSGMGNPGRGGHRRAVQNNALLFQTRQSLASLFHAESADRMILAFNATDALNLAIKGLLRRGDHVITTSVEHNSVIRPLVALRSEGVEHTRVRCDRTGLVDPRDIVRAIRPHTKLVVVCHASNVTGTLQPITEIGHCTRERDLMFLVDAAQSAGVIPIDVQKDCIDLLAFPGHKGLYGPPGTGGLYVGPRPVLSPIRQGGTGTHSELEAQPVGMPDGYESGTHNTLGISGLHAAIGFLDTQGLASIRDHEQRLTKRLLDELSSIDGTTLYGSTHAHDRTAVVSFNLAGWDPTDLAAALDNSFDIAVRAGLHCAPLAHQLFGTFPTGSVRVSPGFFSTDEDITALVDAVHALRAGA